MPNLILDTNLLLLFMVGSYSPKDIPLNDYTNIYDESDFIFLTNYLKIQKSIIITPQILAELSNQAFYIFHGVKQKEFLKILLEKLTDISESYIALKELLKESELFYKIGFTDLSIYELARRNDFVVFTDDYKLNGILRSNKLNSFSFTEERGKVWLN